MILSNKKGDEIELEDIGVYIVGKSENFPAKLEIYAQLGKYTIQNRKYFRKFLNDEKIENNFVCCNICRWCKIKSLIKNLNQSKSTMKCIVHRKISIVSLLFIF